MEVFLLKLMVFAICFASLDIIREIYTFITCYRRIIPYEITYNRMIGVWVSISYIMTIILTGLF